MKRQGLFYIFFLISSAIYGQTITLVGALPESVNETSGLIIHNGLDVSSFQKSKDRLREFGIPKYLVAQNSVQQTTAHVA